MTEQKPNRPLWRAALWGMLIAIGLTVVLLTLYDPVGPLPPGYAGVGVGQAIVWFALFFLAIAAAIGLVVGGIMFRRRRSLLVMVGAPLLSLLPLWLLVAWLLNKV